jgi:hypothetical protein
LYPLGAVIIGNGVLKFLSSGHLYLWEIFLARPTRYLNRKKNSFNISSASFNGKKNSLNISSASLSGRKNSL